MKRQGCNLVYQNNQGFYKKNKATRPRGAEFLREKLCKGQSFFEGAYPGWSVTEKKAE